MPLILPQSVQWAFLTLISTISALGQYLLLLVIHEQTDVIAVLQDYLYALWHTAFSFLGKKLAVLNCPLYQVLLTSFFTFYLWLNLSF